MSRIRGKKSSFQPLPKILKPEADCDRSSDTQMQKGVIAYILAASLVLSFPVKVAALDVFVDLNCPNPQPPYGSWSTAATNIQTAVDAANAGDIVWVTNGLYQTGTRIVPGDTTPNRVAVTKAITVRSVNGAAAAIIKGSQATGTTNGPTAVRCVYLTNGAALIGFTLTNGATQAGSGTDVGLGGGVRCVSPSSVVSNCVLVGNSALFGAGAASGTLSGCILSNNIAQNAGGGYYAAIRSAVSGALNNCLLTGNAARDGGAVDVPGGGRASVNNCTISGNAASSAGGGLSSVGFAAGSFLTASNCIVTGNNAPTNANYDAGFSSEMTLNYCCTAPLPANGVGNFNFDPRFANPAAGDFHLAAGSPCINAGNPSPVGAADLDGQARLVGPLVDLGAYEYQLTAPATLVPGIIERYNGSISGAVLSFTGEIAGPYTSNHWDFGDGTIVTNQLSGVSHSWPAPGDYALTLSAYSADYPSGVSTQQVIHVLANPVHYVSPAGTNPVAPYFSWDTAATNIQDAVDGAYIGGTVLVTNGFYATGATVVGGVTNRVALINPVALRSVNGPAVTVIAGVRVPGTNTGVRCAYLGSNAVLSGFTLTNGASSGNGGGVYCAAITAAISNCVITVNAAANYGGGVYSGSLRNCQLLENVAQLGGGEADSTLESCVLWGNNALAGGGAYRGTLINCLVAGNTATQIGGGAYAYVGTFNGCTIVGNSAGQGAGGAFGGTLNNCILYYNSAPGTSNYSIDGFGHGTLNYCCTTAPLPAGTGSITNEPSFVSLAGADFHLQSNSPCINAGYNAYYGSGAPDVDGNPRISGGTVDIGAYEFQNPASLISYAWLLQHGLPTDGSADFTDTDHDGMNNWQEWICGTEPGDAASVLRLLTPSRNLSGIQVTWQSTSNKLYYLQRGTNLLVQPAFSSIVSNLAGLAGATSFTDTNATGIGPYFYRVGVQP
jgi:PKD domain-containing protein